MLPRTPALSLALAGALLACSSSSPDGAATAATGPAASGDATHPAAGGEGTEDAGAPEVDAPDLCAPPPSRSRCKSESSWVRGVARFDPAHLKAGSKPVLRAVLRHNFTFFKGEEAIGGRLHAWTSIRVDDPSKGEVPFAIDMCGQETAMWSEENGVFHLVLILDEDGNNDLDDATGNDDAIVIGVPGPSEVTKMVDLDISCHAPSQCVDVTLDCTGGVSCTTITPMTSCKKTTPGCPSDSVFCK